MTEKLYYADSHLFSFSARVLRCKETAEGMIAVLDKTAFFPEGGGQAADTGFIGSVRVRDVQEKAGEILHYIEGPVPVGEVLPCQVDAEQRLRRMQNHSGEHILSGLAHRHFGCENVGFHMAPGCLTIDFDRELSKEQLTFLETEANTVIRANLPVLCTFPTAEELAALTYRSKKELTGEIRIVTIGENAEVDRCACCAPHVSRTGEVGLIKLLTGEKHRGGIRITMVAGMEALLDYRQKQENVRRVSELLSVPRERAAEGVERAMESAARQKEQANALAMEYVALKAASLPETAGNLCLFENRLDEIALRELVNLMADKCGGLACGFTGDDENGYRYIIVSRHLDLRQLTGSINAALSGRGGGRGEMIRGSCQAHADTIREFLDK